VLDKRYINGSCIYLENSTGKKVEKKKRHRGNSDHYVDRPELSLWPEHIVEQHEKKGSRYYVIYVYKTPGSRHSQFLIVRSKRFAATDIKKERNHQLQGVRLQPPVKKKGENKTRILKIVEIL
jgi:hypothetical protein